MIKAFIATVICAALCQSAAFAQELTLGSKAPKLELKKFVKGEEVKNFEKGKTYVIELWATWCPPCQEAIPHLTELQKKFSKVVFIGVAVLEEDQDAVPEFVEKMGKKMNYRVALDLVPPDGTPEDGKTVQNWSIPSEMPGIPLTFIVNGEGKVAWIGRPMQLEEVLDQVVEGKWDLVAEAKKVADEKALRKKVAGILGNLQKLYEQFTQDGTPDDLLTSLDSAAKELPEQALDFQLMRFQVLSLTKERMGEALKAANDLLKTEDGEDPQLMNNIAWIIVRPDRDLKADSPLLKLALQVSIKADQLTNNENPSVVDTLAKAYFDNGELANAVKTQERVIELAQGTPMSQDTSLKKRLRQYQKALHASTKTKSGDDAPKSSKN